VLDPSRIKFVKEQQPKSITIAKNSGIKLKLNRTNIHREEQPPSTVPTEVLQKTIDLIRTKKETRTASESSFVVKLKKKKDETTP